MNINNLEKLPVNARNVLRPFLEEMGKIYNEDIVSVFAYGSVTGPDYNPKTSDINVALVLKEISLEKLKPSLKTVRAALRRKITAPLFLSPSYIKKSLDTFPMEFMGMKDSRCVLFGDDILADIDVNREDLRRECEFQLKGKLLTMRQAYLEQALNRKGMERLIKASFRALIPVFRNALRIKRGETPPVDKEKMLRQMGEEFGIDVSSFIEVLHDKKTDGRIADKSAESVFSDFMTQMEKLSAAVDNL